LKEIQRDTGGLPPLSANGGSLVRWAEQGVLLLNTVLTVEDGLPAGHSQWGWEVLTDKIIQTLAAQAKPCAFLLWGAHAQAKVKHIEAFNGNGRHLILKANHPSPLSALRPPLPFLGCGHFGFCMGLRKKWKRNSPISSSILQPARGHVHASK
jgi:uracil-DNA glycosylase